MIRVLQINAGSENFGGVSSMLLNVYRNIDRTKIQFDFLTPNITTYGMYKEEIKKLGGHIYDFHINNETLTGKLKYAVTLDKFLKNHPYDIVHINSGWLSFNCITAMTVKLSGRKQKIIIHSHNNYYRSWWKKILAAPLKFVMERVAQSLMACSETAARNMFLTSTVNKGSVILIKDGIPVEQYAYDESTRDKVRKELDIQDCFVVGHAGRFVKEKNQDFLIDVFNEIYKRNSNAVLLLIGQGALEDSIKEKVRQLGLADKVLFLGQRNDLNKLYQAMDVFILPSNTEGFGMTLIEAQAAGLPCFASTAVPQEVSITDLMHRISLKRGKDIWAKIILSYKCWPRKNYSQQIISAGYSIQQTAQILMLLYEEML